MAIGEQCRRPPTRTHQDMLTTNLRVMRCTVENTLPSVPRQRRSGRGLCAPGQRWPDLSETCPPLGEHSTTNPGAAPAALGGGGGGAGPAGRFAVVAALAWGAAAAAWRAARGAGCEARGFASAKPTACEPTSKIV